MKQKLAWIVWLLIMTGGSSDDAMVIIVFANTSDHKPLMVELIKRKVSNPRRGEDSDLNPCGLQKKVSNRLLRKR